MFTCNFCDSKSFMNLNESLIECKDCGLILKVPIQKDDFEDYFKRCEFEKIWIERETIFKKFLEQIEGRKNCRRILDVGCGPGHFLNLARIAGFEVCGIEPSETARKYAERFEVVIKTNLSDAKFQNSFFDVVTFWNSLEFSSNPKLDIYESYRILRPGGLLFIRTSNISFHLIARDVLDKFNKLFTKLNLPDPTVFHKYNFNHKVLREILFKMCFSNVDIRISVPTPGSAYYDERFAGGIVMFKTLWYIISNVVYLIKKDKILFSTFEVWAEK